MTTATRLRSAGIRSLSPDQAPGLHSWYKIDTLSALSNNDPVTAWPDSSGSSRTLTQATGARQPLYKTNIWNSLPAVLFGGGDDVLVSATYGAVLAQPDTIIMVFKLVAAAGQFFDGPGADRQSVYISGGNWIMWDGSNGPAAAADTNAHVMSQIHNGASSELRIDGALVATGNPNVQGLGGLYLGATQGISGGINGYIGEFVIYSGTPTASLQAVERGLGTKYGITVA